MQILHILEGVNGATERNTGDRGIPSISPLLIRSLLHELNLRHGVILTNVCSDSFGNGSREVGATAQANILLI